MPERENLSGMNKPLIRVKQKEKRKKTMNKAPRFLIEYANYTIGEAEKLIREYPHNTEIYNNAIKNVDKAIFNYQYGYITVNEAIKTINEAFSN